MSADASAYAALGLEPGADWSAVERAYKSLIKTHHPDRSGGDAQRAAEITRAYRELRQARSQPADSEVRWFEPEPVLEAPARSSRWAAIIMGLIAGALIMVLLSKPATSLVDDFRIRSGTFHRPPRAAAINSNLMDRPLATGPINAAIATAARLVRSGDLGRVNDASRACYARFRVSPSLPTFDQCVAFDAAIVQLQNSDPIRDDGPFGQMSVTSRGMIAGGTLSEDYLSVDERLNRIRLQVELALAPPEPPVEPVNVPD